jgi:hypothetical protein
MTAEVSIFLFGKPAWEIEGLEGGELDEALIEEIRAKGKELSQSLEEAADALTRLKAIGWEGTGTLYDIRLFKDISLWRGPEGTLETRPGPGIGNRIRGRRRCSSVFRGRREWCGGRDLNPRTPKG